MPPKSKLPKQAARDSKRRTRLSQASTEAAPVKDATVRDTSAQAATVQTAAAAGSTTTMLQVLQTQGPETTATAQTVTVSTSTMIVQTLTQACASSLAKLRHMFEDNNYEAAYVEFAKPSDKQSLADSDASQTQLKKLQYETLKRGVTERADRLLDLLEVGVADAIKRGYLKTLRFAIVEHSADPSERVEEWALSFQYSKTDSGNGPFVSDMSLQENIHGKSISINQAKRNLGRFISDLAHVCTACLPELPPLVKMFVELDFNETKPPEYCPPGFSNYEAGATRFADSEEWECRTTAVTRMHAGHHHVELGLTYLAPKTEDELDAVPMGMPYTKHRPSTEASEAAHAKTAALSSSGTSSAQRVAAALPTNVQPPDTDKQVPKRSVPVRNEKPQSQQFPIQKSSSKTFVPGTSFPDDSVKTLAIPSSSDMEMKKKVTSMLPPTLRTTYLQETQPRASDVVEPVVEPLVFRQSKRDQLDIDHIDRPHHNDHQKVVKHASSSASMLHIQCACGCATTEDDLICCEYCRTYQHVHCCGYHGGDDHRIPHTHICYSCLLGGESPQNLRSMRDRAIRRRVVHLLSQHGYDGKAQLGKAIGCTEHVTAKIIKHLKDNGVIENVGRNNTAIRLEATVKAKTTINEIYFDPTLGITAHLEGLDPMFADIPTPGTPVPKTRKRPHEDCNHTDGPQKKTYNGSVVSHAILGGDFATPKAKR
ncbi:hypothetical protein HBI46_048770 [Parastagonospora nodorum]|nr:hypothetical protein HBH49_070700 [Parastagonospora nodorum]KAH4175629.1 hypothetical protein HBH43_064900 [Parastagonospora nodorum]KAH4858486.1 hypothetical protein HBH75_049890 [Parastagonospora nodorum]KAH5425185.1 hypothetical protein HBI46_048770 [Parastagonospora nodorum]KAH5524089.1 hypothetical protein HBI29_039410 [Parastagonospora nodorum]